VFPAPDAGIKAVWKTAARKKAHLKRSEILMNPKSPIAPIIEPDSYHASFCCHVIG
jgi:hypothetical protein